MQTEPGKIPVATWATTLALAALMVLTRLGHLGEFSRLPDASWAVFFLGGLLLRDARVFAGFFALAWLVDLGAMALGTPADCFSIAYLFLLPSHAALWWGGRLAARAAARPALAVARGALALWAAVALAFVISNVGFFAFGAVPAIGAADYAARVAGYLPAYLLVATIYTAVALAAGLVAARGFARTTARR